MLSIPFLIGPLVFFGYEEPWFSKTRQANDAEPETIRQTGHFLICTTFLLSFRLNGYSFGRWKVQSLKKVGLRYQWFQQQNNLHCKIKGKRQTLVNKYIDIENYPICRWCSFLKNCGFPYPYLFTKRVLQVADETIHCNKAFLGTSNRDLILDVSGSGKGGIDTAQLLHQGHGPMSQTSGLST